MNMRKALSNLSNSVSTLQRLSLDSVSDHSGRRRTHNFRPSPQDFFMGGEGRGFKRVSIVINCITQCKFVYVMFVCVMGE